MYTVIETQLFDKQASALWSQEERYEFISFIAQNPTAGDVIAGAGGLRKVRWARKGMGKRGGARVIYWQQLADGCVVLLTVYDKSTVDSLSAKFLMKLRQLQAE